VSVGVRPFVAADWPAVLPILREVVRAGETYAYDPAWTDTELRALWVPGAPVHTLVAVDEVSAEVLGTAICGPNRPGRGAHVGTASFMVAAAARGRRVGRLLGEHVLARLTADGYAAVQFNAVVETNEAAVRLWRSLGFTVVGTVPEAFDHPAHGRVGLHVMHRFLPAR
jgi:L-amino acid N-acyltransferase YncA